MKVWDLSSGQELRTLIGHTASVSGVAISSDGRYGLSASLDKTVKVWDLSSGQELLTLSGHTSDVDGVALSSDGRFVLSASGDQTVKVWGLSSGHEVASFTGNGALTCCAIAPDGVTFVVGDSGGQIHFLRLEGVASGTGV